jgi:hypothetical protein
MLYAILCYHDEDVVTAWSKEEDDAVLAKRAVVTDRLAAQGRLGPIARLMPTTAAVTIRSGNEALIIDGPLVECATLEEAIAIARELGQGESGAFEIRPLRLFEPGTAGT